MIRDRNEPARKTALIAMSTATHVVIFTSLGLVPSPSEVLARQEMQFEVVEPPKPEPPPPAPIEEPEPEKPKPAKAQPAPEPEQAEPEPEQAEPEAVETSEEPVADFTGVTLTAEGGGAGWSTKVGSGAPLRGPVGKIGTAPVAAPEAKGPRVLAADRLTRRPEPPQGMDGRLQGNYPRRARVQGVEGQAALRLRILPDGRIGSMKTVSESPGGWEFADACRRTLQEGGRWGRPIGPNGEAVATDVTYTCRFEVY